jgi:transcriptional regulator with XRE-family HTH domain
MRKAPSVSAGAACLRGVRLNGGIALGERLVTMGAAAGDPGRNCTGCDRPLSRYNTGSCCQACVSAGRKSYPVGQVNETLVDGARLAQLRRDHGWTQDLLAGRAGLSTDLVKKLERGVKRSARLSTLTALAQTLDVPVSVLLSGGAVAEPRPGAARQPVQDREATQVGEPARPTLLRALITERHWQRFPTFEARFRRAARELAELDGDPDLAKLTVSSRQWERWYSGNLKTEPHPDACRVLEHMFGYPVQQLLAARDSGGQHADDHHAEGREHSLARSLPGSGQVIPVGRDAAGELMAAEDRRLVERLRRTFLAGGLAALTLPALGLDELRHIAAAVVNARRYADGEIVDYCRRQLDDCAVNDGSRGPRQSLPIALGLIAAIENMATDAKPGTRRELLRVGAYASEFAGWLYRDISVPELANYWRDRAIEWSQVSGDTMMQGYVLLKKSQAVWDERDALRMLTLAEAAQEGPWRLPAHVRAEAAQQQARGHAMLNGNLALIESKLSEARSLLAQDRAGADGRAKEVAPHYDEALFGLQMAICYCEARQPERALELYDRWLSPEMFSRRDYAYFLSLKGSAYAVAGEPDNAAIAGLQAFPLARETESVRTVRELIRLAVQLEDCRDHESVQELRRSVLVA